MKPVAFASDHSGFQLKQKMIPYVRELGYDVIDLGGFSEDRISFPSLARAMGKVFREGRAERGVMICGSGIGACMGLNRIPGIRASVVHDPYSAHQGVEHDDMNAICLGGQIIGPWLAGEILQAFLSAGFSTEEFFVTRTRELDEMELEAARQLLPALKERGWA